ncbi:3-deoxy-7-phosphoheptulonate synthase [Ferrimonas senticii]|uniref:3-deoxy-7-phosphoheptulonate synthase n=1 Tax=Ferrimonas senticii TaxID=394566 RepID=UPI000416D9BE|nr:3-deoxy-7-phosphoheptulonate synthase [Ferrimonas senticii]
MTIKTDELRTTLLSKVISPAQLAAEFPLSDAAADNLVRARRDVEAILEGKDDRLLVIIGPCSIHDPQAALDYADKLVTLQQKYRDDLLVVMRVYFEKPRTTVGWKGLISDPDLDGSYCADKGLRLARQLLVQIAEKQLPIATEFLDMVNGQYIADLITWGAIGARTTESQIHREMASALSCPVGFKNGTDGNMKIAIDAVRAAREPHIFYSPDKDGLMSVYRTHGNPYGHVILRGGKQPNYQAEYVIDASERLAASGVLPRLVIDFSHGNSLKQHQRQLLVADDVMAQMQAPHGREIAGIMAESFLIAGQQQVEAGKPLTYGQSITDGCLGWDESAELLEKLASASRNRRNQS